MEIFLLAGDKREYLCVNPTRRTRYIRGGVQHELSISGRVWTTQESLKNPPFTSADASLQDINSPDLHYVVCLFDFIYLTSWFFTIG